MYAFGLLSILLASDTPFHWNRTYLFVKQLARMVQSTVTAPLLIFLIFHRQANEVQTLSKEIYSCMPDLVVRSTQLYTSMAIYANYKPVDYSIA